MLVLVLVGSSTLVSTTARAAESDREAVSFAEPQPTPV